MKTFFFVLSFKKTHATVVKKKVSRFPPDQSRLCLSMNRCVIMCVSGYRRKKKN